MPICGNTNLVASSIWTKNWVGGAVPPTAETVVAVNGAEVVDFALCANGGLKLFRT